MFISTVLHKLMYSEKLFIEILSKLITTYSVDHKTNDNVNCFISQMIVGRYVVRL